MAASLDEDIKFHCHVNHGGDQLIQKAISHVWTFLKDFIPLANTHGAEFLSDKHWEKFITSSMRQELLMLNEEELVSLPLGKFETFPSKLRDAQGTCKSGCLQSEVGGQLKSHLNPKGSEKNEWELVSECDVQNDISNAFPSSDDNGLNSFVLKACECHLENLGILTSSEEALSGQNHQSKSIIAEAMSEKKSHEVKVMSNTLSTMMRASAADLVVDVGSGKGYLSMELADHQNIGVLGLDSSASNTDGAKVRKKKLKSRWSGLVAKEDSKIRDADNQSKDLQEYSETDKLNDTCNRYAETNTVETSSLPHVKTAERFSKMSAKTKKASILPHTITVETSKLSLVKTMETSNSLDAQTIETSSLPHAKTVDSTNTSLYVPLTMNVNPKMNLRQVVADHAAHLCRDGKKVEEIKYILTGLHTCGSLAVSTLLLFVKDAGAVGVCCVGCCYQLLDEQTEEGEGDFPLSQYGKSLNLCLGRNARNLASQSVHRLKDSKQLQGKDFYWRALLDVLLRELSLRVPERIMGMRKLNKQCTTFYEYAVKALEKLGFGSAMITRERVQTLEDDHQHEQIRMAAFFQFKLVLAPVIESLILLDRLLYLVEQDCIGQAFLVRLFDPIRSPRCYALLAYK